MMNIRVCFIILAIILVSSLAGWSFFSLGSNLKPSSFRELSRRIISLEDIVLRNQRLALENLNEVQQIVVSSLKQWLPKTAEVTNSSLLEQMHRKQRIREVCRRFAAETSRDPFYFEARSPIFSQQIRPESFLIAQTPRTVVCYNHKVASSTWMSTFTKLLGDEAYYQKLSKSGSFYKVKTRMSPSSAQDLLEILGPGNYFTFTVVRHPFDRLLSAFRDRILHGCTGQAKHHVPQIFYLTRKSQIIKGTATLFNRNDGCIKIFPTFQEFVEYVLARPEQHDPHWFPYTKNCSPCLIDYDAIIKLESSKADEEFVMQQSGIDQYSTSLEYKHFQTNPGRTEELRSQYFSNITCNQLQKLEQTYKMDMEMFDYSIDAFKQFCVHDK